jgi:glycosyltransferase involved in cell wall biosynthesis
MAQDEARQEASRRPRSLLVLADLTDATGNAVTARRLAAHLGRSYKVTLVDARTVTLERLRSVVDAEGVSLAIGVHALLSGPWLRVLGIPYALVFGGTDLYEPVHGLHGTQMARAVADASALLAYSPENRERAETLWPAAAGRVRCFPKAVEVPAQVASFDLRERLGLARDSRIVLLPTGIRRVKDPLYAVDAFTRWHAEDPRIHLVIVGAVLERDYAESALATIAAAPGVHYLEALARPEMLAAIRDADIVLNSSCSEGMSGTVLEAMALRTPVVARRNAGNESLISCGRTGLLFDRPERAVDGAHALLSDAALAQEIAHNALAFVSASHSIGAERAAIEAVVRDLQERTVAGNCPKSHRPQTVTRPSEGAVGQVGETVRYCLGR